MNIKIKLADNYLLSSLAIVVIILVVFFNINNKSSQTDNVYDTAQRLIYKQDYFESQGMYENILRKNAQDMTSYLKIAEIQTLRGNFQLAIDYLLKNSEKFENKLPFYSQITYNYYLIREYEQVLIYGEETLNFSFNDSFVQNLVVKSYVVLGRYKQAYDFISKYNENDLSEKNLFYKIVLGIYLGESKNTSVILFNDSLINNLYLKIENCLPDYQNITTKIFGSINITYELLEANYFELALPFTDEIIALNKYFAVGYYYKGFILLNIGEYSKAENLLTSALEMKNDSTDFAVLLIASQIAQNKSESVDISLLQLDKYISETDNYKLSELLKLSNAYKKSDYGLKIFKRYEPFLRDDLVSIYLAVKFEALNKYYNNLLDDINKILSEVYYLNDQQKAVLYGIKGFVLFTNSNMKAGEDLVKQGLILDKHSYFCYYYLAQINLLQNNQNGYNQNIANAKKYDYNNEFEYE